MWSADSCPTGLQGHPGARMCHSQRGWRNTEQNLRQAGKACDGACGHLTRMVHVQVQWRWFSDERQLVHYPTPPALTGDGVTAISYFCR